MRYLWRGKIFVMINIVKHIPNSITSMNLLCGVLGILSCSVGDNLPLAFVFMLAGAVFDFCDGLAARALHAYSPMGKELDSLADVVSFGVLPSIMLVCFARNSFNNALDLSFCVSGAERIFVTYIPVVIAVFSGLRLAKFNVDERQSENFIGLATPACAMMLGSLVCFGSVSDSALSRWLTDWPVVCILVPVLSLLLSFLLVSEVPMFAMKIKKGANLFSGLYGKLRIAFFVGAIAIVLAVVLCRINISIAIFFIFLYYIVLNLIALPLRPRGSSK